MSYEQEETSILKAMTVEDLVEADEDSAVIVYNEGQLADRTPYWVYMEVKPSRYREFMQMTKDRKPLRLGQYGTILKHGFEQQVPDHVKEEMRQLHGCDDNYMACLVRDVKRAQIASLKEGREKKVSDILLRLKDQQ